MINGICFYAQRIRNSGEEADVIECKMQIWNLQRHLRKGLTKTDQIKKKETETIKRVQMSEDDLKQFWFYMSKKEMDKTGGPRIKNFKEIGWVDPFILTQNEPVESP